MKSKLKNQRAQQVAEYAILIALVLAAIIGMKVYLQRGLQARYRGATLEVTQWLRDNKQNQELPLQYEPYYLKSEYVVNEQSYQNMQYSSPLPLMGQTTINKQSTTDRRGNQETLSANYGD